MAIIVSSSPRLCVSVNVWGLFNEVGVGESVRASERARERMRERERFIVYASSCEFYAGRSNNQALLLCRHFTAFLRIWDFLASILSTHIYHCCFYNSLLIAPL